MKLTPLNIVVACIFAWVISEWGEEGKLLSWGWTVVLAVTLLLIDLFFRLVFKEMKRIWILEVGFILLASILILLLKVL